MCDVSTYLQVYMQERHVNTFAHARATYTQMHTYTHIYIYIEIDTYIYIWTGTHTHTRTHTCTHTHTHTHTHLHRDWNILLHMQGQHTHTHTHKCTYTHTQIVTSRCDWYIHLHMQGRHMQQHTTYTEQHDERFNPEICDISTCVQRVYARATYTHTEASEWFDVIISADVWLNLEMCGVSTYMHEYMQERCAYTSRHTCKSDVHTHIQQHITSPTTYNNTSHLQYH